MRATNSRRTWTRLATAPALAVALMAGSACVNVFWRTEPRDLSTSTKRGDTTITITTPIKAHLRSGETVLFVKGGVVSTTHVAGTAQRYAFMSALPQPAAPTTIPLDSIVGFETFDAKVQAGPTAVVSLAATAAGIFGTALLAIAIFGSCPTIYADTGSAAVLQAEGFSYAISPIFRQRDIDPLTVARTAEGTVRLELRNEALETHYVDHLELTKVRHARSEFVVPDQHGQVVAVSSLQPPIRAVDRGARNVMPLVLEADEQLFATSPSRLAIAHAGDLDDWIDLDAGLDRQNAAQHGDSIAIVLRLRNSLLNTVLLYEGMLSGAAAPDWLASGIRQPAQAVALGSWYRQRMGLRVSIGDDTVSARIGDIGPLAFRDVAIVVPRPRTSEHARIRLRFVADNWRIDQIRIATHVRRPATERLTVQRVKAPTTGGTLVHDTAAVRLLSAADQQHLETRPGQRMVLEFDDLVATPPDSATRYLVVWQGWYNEWIRPGWINAPNRTRAFVPGDSALGESLVRWRTRKSEFEQQFYSTRIPTR